MQIVCNNCGNSLSFPNYQYQVTCPTCYTHLQIEETENFITATIVENAKFDDAIFESSPVSNLSRSEFIAPLFTLLHLEGEYDEIIEENFFYSLSIRQKSRPMLLRGLYRLFFAIVFFWFAYATFNDSDIGILGLVPFGGYAVFLLQISIKELISKKRLWQFEKRYYKEKEMLLEDLMLANDISVKQEIRSLNNNYKEEKAIEKEFCYIDLFDRMKIPVGVPSISKGLRLFAISVPIGLLGLIAGFDGYSIAFLVTILAVVIVLFGFFLLADVSEYKRVKALNTENRKEILKTLSSFAKRYI